MQHLNYSTLETAACFLEGKTGSKWTPDLVVDRLRRLVLHGNDDLRRGKVHVLLPPGWRLEDVLTGERVAYDRPMLAEVSIAEDFLEQLGIVGDANASVGRPMGLLVGRRRLRTVDLLPASHLRLLPSDLRALANLPEPESITPYHDLIDDLRAGAFPEMRDVVSATAGYKIEGMGRDDAVELDAGWEPDINGLVAWQRVLLESWPRIVAAFGGKPKPRDAMRWLKANGPRDVIPGDQRLSESLQWLGGDDGSVSTVALKTIQNVIANWKRVGRISPE